MSDTTLSTSDLKTKRKKVDVYEGLDPEVKERSKKMLMYLIIFAVIMMFGALNSAYIIKEPENYWVHPEPVFGLKVSNVILVLSSVLLILAGYFAKQNKQIISTVLLVATFISGLAFTFNQWSSWTELNEKGFFLSHNKIGDINAEYGKEYMVTYNSVPLIHENGQFYLASDKDRTDSVTSAMNRQQDTSTSLLFVFILGHALHLLLGLIYLVVNIIRSVKGEFEEGNILSLKTQGIYWHFMGILWLYLYVFLFIFY